MTEHSLSEAIKTAIVTYFQDSDGDAIMTGQAVTIGLVDVLASVLAGSPQAELLRDRKLLVDEVAEALRAQINAYRELKGAPLETPKFQIPETGRMN